MAQTLPPIALLGTGKMVGAILEGLLSPEVTTSTIRATTNTEASAELLRQKGVEAASLETDPMANEWAVAEAKIVILGVKPAYILELAQSVSHALDPDAIVVSVAAGITTAQLEGAVSNPVVRAMPNTPAQIQQGVTGLAAGSRASADQVAEVSAVFDLVGDVVVVKEDDINVLSALSGSGPAYLFYVAEKMMDVATTHGFSAEQARTMVQGTLLGAAALLDVSGDTPEQLRAAVTSPGGTTEQAIAVFDEHNLGAVFAEAVERAVARAVEMAQAK